MRKISVIVIGGGASGLAASVMLARSGASVTLLERGERVGRKLSATGNGQGNVTNLAASKEHYFSDDPEKVGRILGRFSAEDTVEFLQSMGGIFLPDSRGRVYPAGRTASAVTDLFRREVMRLGVSVLTGVRAEKVTYAENSFRVTWKEGYMSADKVLLSAGGRAAEHFGTDGTAYTLAESFGHTVTPLTPVLVRLKTDPALVRGLRGIRVDALVRVLGEGGTLRASCRGDLLFTDGGVSGDAVFRASSYARKGDTLSVDLLPDVDEGRLRAAMERGGGDPLLGIVPNGLAKFLTRMGGDLAARVKDFRLPVTGTWGFSEAQVTRGGIPLGETDEDLQSLCRTGLFFAGEILNADGECGGYNLQWAFSSAHAAAEGILKC